MFSVLFLCLPYLYSAKREELSPAFQVVNPKKIPAPRGAGADLDGIFDIPLPYRESMGRMGCNRK